MKTKKHFFGMALFAIIALVFTVGASGSGTKGGSTPVQETIVCLGDSLTSGFAATVVGKDDKSKAWPAVLQNKVNIPVINAGVPGNTTAQGLARVKKDVLSKNPRIVIIELGINDYFKKIPLATTKNNLQKIIDMVNDGKRKIYLIRTYQDWNDQVDNMFNTLASSNNIEQIDASWPDVWGVEEMSNKNDKTVPGGHPNPKGHELIAEYIFNALKPYLEDNNLLKE